MHEVSIAIEIHRVSREAVARRRGKIERVAVQVGELSGVDPEILAHAWEAVVGEGPDRGARLDVEWKPARQYCAACGAHRRASGGGWIRECPACGELLHIEGGTELDVTSVDFEEAEGEHR